MIRSWRHKGLRELFENGRTARIRSDLLKRVRVRLNTLAAATVPEDLNLPGFNFHKLANVERWTVHVNGPWCITFGWDDGAIDVDLEQYH